MIELKPTKVKQHIDTSKLESFLMKEKTGKQKVIRKSMAQDVNVVMPSLDLFSKTK